MSPDAMLDYDSPQDTGTHFVDELCAALHCSMLTFLLMRESVMIFFVQGSILCGKTTWYSQDYSQASFRLKDCST